MCRSNQVNEISEEKSSSEEECNLIQCFYSCDEFKIMMVDSKKKTGGREMTDSKLRGKSEKETNQEITKIDIRRDPRSHKIKALTGLVRNKRTKVKLSIWQLIREVQCPSSIGQPQSNYWMDQRKLNLFRQKN